MSGTERVAVFITVFIIVPIDVARIMCIDAWRGAKFGAALTWCYWRIAWGIWHAVYRKLWIEGEHRYSPGPEDPL